ncbi:Rossmann-fold NAD(P)(+)-binding protein [Candidatus Hepatincola sp. Av]
MIIVGFGISAMISVYYALKNNANVLVLTKSVYNQNYYNWQLQGGCSWKTHAFNMPVNKEDIAYFIEDTLVGSGFFTKHKLHL